MDTTSEWMNGKNDPKKCSQERLSKPVSTAKLICINPNTLLCVFILLFALFFPQSLIIYILPNHRLFTVPAYIISLWIHLFQKKIYLIFLSVLFSPKHNHIATIMTHFNLKDREVWYFRTLLGLQNIIVQTLRSVFFT